VTTVPTQDAIIDLVTIAWNLEKMCLRPDTPAHLLPQLRYFGRRLAAVAQQLGGEAIDLTGSAFEDGLAVDVVEVNGSREQPLVICEMVSPIVQLDGKVARFGQVMLATKAER
jgi:hypothetical protein